MPGYGSVVLLANKERFREAVSALEADVMLYSEGVKDEIQKQIDHSRGAVVEALLPAVKRNPPDE
ncbi:MAG: hypothetical protein GEU90_09905 [Gemmatimonas sp.]|nr:hypothetical protein [Gemmatimonas sp.]